MRLCSINEIEDGAILGKSIYDVNSRLLLKKGISLSTDMKLRIKKRGYNYVYIMEEGTEDVNPEDMISDQIRLQANIKLLDKTEEIRRITKFQDISHDKAVKLIEDGHLKKINISTDMKKIVGEIIKDISTAGVKSLNTLMLKSQDTYFMDHAINTTVLAILIAQKYKFNSKEISSLALGTFLHDIGKTIVEQLKDYNNPKKAKEYYLQHPKFGYELLRNSHNITPMENQIVYQHHEYQDGSGFPTGLAGENLPPVSLQNRNMKGRIFRLAEICCVADAYDKMVLNPTSEKQMDSQSVMKEIVKNSGTKYNKDVVQTLFQVVPAYQIGVYVQVIDASDQALINYIGVVAKINENNPNNPVIIINRDRHKKKIKPQLVNTSELKKIKLKVIL